MTRHRVLALVLVVACGGSKPKTEQPDHDVTPPVKHVETEADRVKARHDAALAIVPAGSTCLPPVLEAKNAPRLELAGVGADAILCAIDTDPDRLLGPIGCWKVDLAQIDPKTNSPTLVYQDPAPLPGHAFDVKVDGICARGFCLPDTADMGDGTAHMSWSLDGKQVALLVGGTVHIYDAAAKTHLSSFNVKGDKGVTTTPVAVYFANGALFVEGRDDSSDAIWGFKADGTPLGPIMPLGGDSKAPLSIVKGAFSVLDQSQVALADHGMETLTTYEVATGKRTKSVRKIGKLTCKQHEIDSYWKGGDKVTDACRTALEESSAPLIGATAVMGTSSLLVVMRGSRLGELAVMDPKTLTEKRKAFVLPTCTGAAAAPATDDAPKTRGPVKKSGDPCDGGN